MSYLNTVGVQLFLKFQSRKRRYLALQSSHLFYSHASRLLNFEQVVLVDLDNEIEIVPVQLFISIPHRAIW